MLANVTFLRLAMPGGRSMIGAAFDVPSVSLTPVPAAFGVPPMSSVPDLAFGVTDAVPGAAFGVPPPLPFGFGGWEFLVAGAGVDVGLMCRGEFGS